VSLAVFLSLLCCTHCPYCAGADADVLRLAYAEMYDVLGTIFRRFKFELYDTTRADVDMVHDFFLPSPSFDSKGIRVKVVDVEEM
jgi:hypothetical protein